MSGVSMPPYSGDDAVCIKCGGSKVETAWRAQDEARPGSWAQVVRHVPGQPERLERACGRCGYVWEEALTDVDAENDDPLVPAGHEVWQTRDSTREWTYRCLGIRYCDGDFSLGHATEAAARAAYEEHASACHGVIPTEQQLHRRFRHPNWEYETTEGQRKMWDDQNTPPVGDGWERNVDAGRDGWERFDYTEESYWRRPKAT